MGKITDMDFSDDKPCEYDDDGICIHHGAPRAFPVDSDTKPAVTDPHTKVLLQVRENVEKAAAILGQTGIVVAMGERILGSRVPIYGQMDTALRPLAEAFVRCFETLDRMVADQASLATSLDNIKLS